MNKVTKSKNQFGPYSYTVVHIARRGTRIDWDVYPPVGTRIKDKFSGKLLSVIEQQACGMLGAVSDKGYEECGFPHDYEYVGEAAERRQEADRDAR